MARKKRRSSRQKVSRIVLIILLIAVVGSVLMVLPFRWLNPPVTSFILRDKLASDVDLRKHWVPFERVSSYLPRAIVAAEDQKFFIHYGFDVKALQKAMNERRGRKRGASTITQQLAKNLYLSANRSLLRKGFEAYLTLLIETFWSKERILEVYINCVEFGPGVFGVGMASQRFFNKSASQLSMQESTQLAAILPNPKKMSARAPSDYVKQRAYDIQRSIPYVPWK